MGANDPRSGASPFPGMPYPVPPMPYTDPRSLWLGPAVLGMLLVQFLLLALLAWKTLVPESGEPAAAPVAGGRTVALTAGSDAVGDVSRVAREAEIQLQLLDRIVDQLGQGTPRGLVPLLEQFQQENETLKAENERLKTELFDKSGALGQLTRTYEDLKHDSEASRFEMRKYMLFFFSGAAILFVGVLLGLVMKRSRRKSSLLG